MQKCGHRTALSSSLQPLFQFPLHSFSFFFPIKFSVILSRPHPICVCWRVHFSDPFGFWLVIQTNRCAHDWTEGCTGGIYMLLLPSWLLLIRFWLQFYHCKMAVWAFWLHFCTTGWSGKALLIFIYGCYYLGVNIVLALWLLKYHYTSSHAIIRRELSTIWSSFTLVFHYAVFGLQQGQQKQTWTQQMQLWYFSDQPSSVHRWRR